VGKRETIELGYAIRDDNGELIAGLIGSIVWTMLHINVIWVSDVLRGNNIGSKLMLQAEQEAKQQGCEFARLRTFSFQARPFYERLGYIVINEAENFPTGHSQYLMVKAL
jgi:ribosomal protein S18 acetylase RimI-like enzyme